MSSGAGMPYLEAYNLGAEISRRLAPHVVRSKAAGSLRRKRPRVGDLEFVVEPKMRRLLLGPPEPDLEPLKREVLTWSTWHRGGDRYWRVKDVLGSGCALDLFLVWPPAEWGSILAIRTGPAELGQFAVTVMKDRRTPHVDGHVPGHPTPTEEDFFALAGLDTVAPALRDDYWQRLRRRRR